jgi:Glycosyl transferase family 2
MTDLLMRVAASARRRARRAYFRSMERFVRPTVLRLRILVVRMSVRHVHGPKRIKYGDGEVIAICVVRNGELHVRSFLTHHFALGVRHVVFLLNDSTDQTSKIAMEYENVTLLRANCSYSRYENAMKTYLAHRFSMGRWNLCVDIDELFEYPYSEELPFGAVLEYLNEHGSTAVIAQLLDMFSDGPIELVRSHPDDQLRALYPYYDISNIRKTNYEWLGNGNQQIKMHSDGIRHQMFRTHICLTKAALVKISKDIDLFVNWHHVRGARIADFTAVLLHYPFVETFANKVADAVATGRYGPLTSEAYNGYWRELNRKGEGLILRQASASRFSDVLALVKDGFLVTGPSFLTWRQARLAANERAEDREPN